MIKSFRLLITVSLVLFCSSLYAQRLSGIVLDRNTLLPISHTTISTSKQSVFTSALGQFTITNLHKGDTIRVSCVGYKYNYMIFSQAVSDTIRIYLEQAVVPLNSVVIIGKRSSNTDSIKLRKEFAPVFAYKGTTFKDVFIPNSTNILPYNDFITSTNSTTRLLSVNLLSVIDWLGKNKTPTSKLQQTLLRDEQSNYVNQVFSRPKVIELTRLKGDSLQTFMDKYRPSASNARSMTDYEVMIYIKKCYAEFLKPEQK